MAGDHLRGGVLRRAMALTMLLTGRRFYSSSEIADRVGITQRHVRRSISMLVSAGIPVQTIGDDETSRGHRHRIHPDDALRCFLGGRG